MDEGLVRGRERNGGLNDALALSLRTEGSKVFYSTASTSLPSVHVIITIYCDHPIDHGKNILHVGNESK